MFPEFLGRFFMPYPAPTTFETIAGILRLSHKYEVDYLRRRALVHLSSMYPTRLSAVDDGLKPDVPAWNKPSWEPSRTAHATAINLAREVNAPWVLPCAFYRAAAYTPVPFASTNVSSTLSCSDQSSLTKGQFWQSHVAVPDILCFLYHPPILLGCEGGKNCLIARLLAFEYLREALASPTDPLFIWDDDDWESLQVCQSCLPCLKAAHKIARVDFWKLLPDAYGLPSWEELEKLRTEAIGGDLF
jgi:hypothetical protein